MTRNLPTENQGFIALISILIISTVLLGTTLSLAQFGIANRFFILNLEQKTDSEKLAEACVHIARINVYNNPEREVTEATTYPIGDKSCQIVSVEPNGDESTVQVSAENGKSVTNLEVVIENTSGDFISWEELPTL